VDPISKHNGYPGSEQRKEKKSKLLEGLGMSLIECSLSLFIQFPANEAPAETPEQKQANPHPTIMSLLGEKGARGRSPPLDRGRGTSHACRIATKRKKKTRCCEQKKDEVLKGRKGKFFRFLPSICRKGSNVLKTRKNPSPSKKPS